MESRVYLLACTRVENEDITVVVQKATPSPHSRTIHIYNFNEQLTPGGHGAHRAPAPHAHVLDRGSLAFEHMVAPAPSGGV